MALIDSVNDDSPSEFEAEEQKQAQAAQAQEQQPEKPKLPSKYEGKTIEEVVQMHQEAEKLIGRQAQEVGEVRKLADQLLKQNLAAKQPEPPQEKEVDFFEDPQKAIERAVANHPSVLAAQQAAAQMKAMQTQQQLAVKHPDFTDVIRDGEFLEWVKASPIRLNMFALADSQYDFAAADELLSTFKQIRSVKAKETVETGQKSLNKTTNNGLHVNHP